MTTCLIITGDLMLQSQVTQAAKAVNFTCRAHGTIDSLMSEAESTDVRMVIVDLQSVPAESLAGFAERLQLQENPPVCLAVGPHVYKQLLERGTQAGWTVVTRGQLHAQLADRLRDL